MMTIQSGCWIRVCLKSRRDTMFIAYAVPNCSSPFMGGRNISLLWSFENQIVRTGLKTFCHYVARTPRITRKGTYDMDFGLKNRIALVAAASRGIGFASARALAREGS